MTGPARDATPIALITGAHGGMGAACARVFARRYKLVLNDRDQDRLEALRVQLQNDGAAVVQAIAGDISSEAVIGQITGAVKDAGRLGALVHTAGLSPSLAGWEPILNVNLTGSIRLLDAVEPLLQPGTAGVVIASIAGYSLPISDALKAAVDALILKGDAGPAAAAIQAAGDDHAAGAAYAISKYGVLRLVEQRSRAWAQAGARLTSISPGMISTPMGRLEATEKPMAGAMVAATPAGRWGTPLDIANAAEFLCSDLASFISGCDLRVDGGLVGAMNSGQVGGIGEEPRKEA